MIKINLDFFSKKSGTSKETDNSIRDFQKELQDKLDQNNSKLDDNILFTLDRFEGDFAICENKTTGEMINIPKELIASSAKAGAILKIENGKYVLDEEETAKAQREIKDLANNLFKRK